MRILCMRTEFGARACGTLALAVRWFRVQKVKVNAWEWDGAEVYGNLCIWAVSAAESLQMTGDHASGLAQRLVNYWCWTTGVDRIGRRLNPNTDLPPPLASPALCPLNKLSSPARRSGQNALIKLRHEKNTCTAEPLMWHVLSTVRAADLRAT